MPGSHHHRHRFNRKGHKKQKQKIPSKSKSPNSIQINNENPIENQSVDLNITYDAPTNKTITVNESKILQELYGDNEISKHSLQNQSNNASSIDLKKSHTQTSITITTTIPTPSDHQQLQSNMKNIRHKHKHVKDKKDELSEDAKYQYRKTKSHNTKISNMHLILTTRSPFEKNLADVSPSMSSTKQKNKANELMMKTPNNSDSRIYGIYTPYSKKRPFNNSPSDQSSSELSSTNATRSISTSWTITSQAKRSRRASLHPPDKICCTPKRLFHDQQPPSSTPITLYNDNSSKNQIISGGGGDPHHQSKLPCAISTSIMTKTIEKCNKLTFTNISAHSITEYNEQVHITMSMNYSNNDPKLQQLIPNDLQSTYPKRFSWFNSITSSFHNLLSNVKRLLIQDWVSNMLRSSYNNVLVMNAMMDFVIKKWATITLKRQTSNLGSTIPSTHQNHITTAIGQHADCYAQIQIMQRTIRDLTAIAEEQNKKIEILTNEVMELKIKSSTAPFNGLVFGSGCNNCGNSGSSSIPTVPSSSAPPIPPPPPPPLPPFSLIKPMNNTLLREKKTGSRQLQQRSSSIGTDRPAITLEDILSVKLKKTKPVKQIEPEPKISNVNILSKSKLKQVRLRTKSRVRSRGASPAQQFFDNCKSGTNSLLELLENSSRNIQVQNLMTKNQSLI